MGKTDEASPTEFLTLDHPLFPLLSLAVEDGEPVVLETRPRSTVYLGGICDSHGQVREFLELWVQDFSRDRSALTLPVPNVLADRQWKQLVKGYAENPAQDLWRGTWEEKCLGAFVIDSKEWWPICEDDGILKKKELPTYSGSEFRYLRSPDGQALLALSPDAPLGPDVRMADEVFKGRPVFNREGGRMMIRQAAPFDFGRFVDFLTTEGSTTLKDAMRFPLAELQSNKVPSEGMDRSGQGFIHARSGVSDRMAEIFFLKLCALRGAMAAVTSAVKTLKIPFGGITADSFAVDISATGTGLPFLWTHQVLLRDAPGFAPFPLGPTGENFPLAIAPDPGSIYSPPGQFQARSGLARMHVKTMTAPDDEGLVVFSGTLRTPEPLETSRKDLLRLQFKIGGGKRGEFYATLDTLAGDDEWRFLSYPFIPPEGMDVESMGESGTLFEKVSFDLFPGVGSTRDLHSLGVLAFRVLFSISGSDLSERLDEFHVMLRRFGGGSDDSQWATGSGRLLDFVNSPAGDKWREKFGPRNVIGKKTLESPYDATPRTSGGIPSHGSGNSFRESRKGVFRAISRTTTGGLRSWSLRFRWNG